MEIKLPGLQQDPQWEKNIDRTTHHLSLLRYEVMSWRLVEWRVLVFLTGWPVETLFSPGYVAFGLGAHPKVRKRVGVDGFIRGSQEAGKAWWHFLFAFTVQGKNSKPHS